MPFEIVRNDIVNIQLGRFLLFFILLLTELHNLRIIKTTELTMP